MGYDPRWFEQMEEILSEQEELLTQEAQAMTENFWAQIQERKQQGENEGTLGVRVIPRDGGKLQILWYRKRWIGPKGQKRMISNVIPKGRGRDKYPSQRFARFTKWERDLAEMFEPEFALLRAASGAVTDQRKAMKKAYAQYERMGYIDAEQDTDKE